MRSFWKVVLVVLFVFAFQCEAKANEGNNGNHYGWYKWKGGNANASSLSIANQWQAQSQSQTQAMNVGNVTGATVSASATAPTTVTANSPVSIQSKVVTWPGIPVTVAGDALPYYGQYKEVPLSARAQPWFRRAKWSKKDFEAGYPNHATIVPAFTQDGSKNQSTYLMPFDGISQKVDFSGVKNTYYLGDIVCSSKDAESTPESIWGGCAPTMMEQGARAAVLIDGYVTDGVSSKKLTGGVSGVFMSIFGSLFTAGAGPTIAGSDDVVRPYRHIVTTWMCYRPMTQEEIDEAAKK